jgi:beta-phosphoglucomutase-like phosphatase (HAD superfamily)
MILAVIFDLDGTLVETEELKALSYARAAVELRPELREAEVVEAFKDVVGLSRQEVAKGLLQRFGLEAAARARLAEFGVSSPWQAYVQVRQRLYEAMLADPALLRRQQYPHNIAYLEKVQRQGCRIALATMSYCKPDPEIYLLVARELGVPAADCLVIEDSPAGVKAALAAGMNVVAVSTPFTRQRLHESGLLPPQHIVDDPGMLPDVIAHVIAHHRHA